MESAAMRTSNFKLNVRRLIERRLQHSRYFHIIGNYDSVIYSKKKQLRGHWWRRNSLLDFYYLRMHHRRRCKTSHQIIFFFQTKFLRDRLYDIVIECGKMDTSK